MPELQQTPTNGLGLIIRLPSPGFLRRLGQPSEVPVYLLLLLQVRAGSPGGSYPSSGAGQTGVLRPGTPGSVSAVDDACSPSHGMWPLTVQAPIQP